MKITIFLFFSFFLLASYSLAAAPDPVLDIAGKNLLRYVPYYIVPVPRLPYERHSGLALEVSRNKTCPLDVVEEILPESDGRGGVPVQFYPVNFKKGVIRESTDMNVAFLGNATCYPYSDNWKVDDYDQLRKQYFVTNGGVYGHPGADTINSWFKIQKYFGDYKFVFCPSVCKYCKVMCKDVGIFVENGKRFLVLSDVPLRVKFHKVYN